MKKLYIACISALLLASCNDLSEMNVDPRKPTVVPAQTLFSNAQKAMVDVMASTSVNRNIFRLITQQWTECTYFDEAQYDLTTRNIPQTFWNTIYRDVLRDFDEARVLIEADKTYTDAALKKNRLALVDLMEVYSYSVLVNTFGNVPYSEALDYKNIHPKYDDAKTISDDLIKRIDADLAALSTSSTSFGDADILFKGDVAKWKKFGNSLKMRLGMIIADSDPAKAKTIVEAAVAGAIASNADNADFPYLNAPPSTNPLWVDLVQSGRKDFVGDSSLVNSMKRMNDPRLSVYFTKDLAGGYSGGIAGVGNNYATYSKPGVKFTAPDLSQLLIDYSEMEFLKAEAIERGMNVGGGLAVDHFGQAIQASMDYYGVGTVDASSYITKAKADYVANGWKKSIGIQKWIAFYNRPYDAWTEWRRLDYPALKPSVGAKSGIPVRLTYSVNEQNTNTAKYNEAASAIGGDKVETKLFWDKF